MKSFWKRGRLRAAVACVLLIVFSGVLLKKTGRDENRAPDFAPATPPFSSQSYIQSGSCASLPTESIQVFFTTPGIEAAPPILHAFLQLIDSASVQICCAFYDLENEDVARALINKHHAGVQVAIVSDSNYDRRKAVKQCLRAGIPVVFDTSKAFMHNKFCVVDGRFVWTGSTNITQNGFYKNNNNALLINSQELAVNYINEFEEMFLHRLFGAGSPKNTAFPLLSVSGISIQCYFAPEDGAAQRIIDCIQTAKTSIDFMAFSFTSVPIAEAMAQRMRHGVKVRGLFEKRDADSQHSRYRFLKENGAEVHLDINPNNMHHKVIVVDREHVITGSYNFSKSAETRNDENILILHSRDIADCYVQELERQVS